MKRRGEGKKGGKLDRQVKKRGKRGKGRECERKEDCKERKILDDTRKKRKKRREMKGRE